jgi:hypothetical protein
MLEKQRGQGWILAIQSKINGGRGVFNHFKLHQPKFNSLSVPSDVI